MAPGGRLTIGAMSLWQCSRNTVFNSITRFERVFLWVSAGSGVLRKTPPWDFAQHVGGPVAINSAQCKRSPMRPSIGVNGFKVPKSW